MRSHGHDSCCVKEHTPVYTPSPWVLALFLGSFALPAALALWETGLAPSQTPHGREPPTPVLLYNTNHTNHTNHEGLGCGSCHLASLDRIPRNSASNSGSGGGSPMGV
jgi:hypothetical protein